MTRKTTSAATVLTGAILLGLAATGASAAPGPVDRETTKVADAAQARAVAEAEEDESANCSRSRKRLWIEGEGWVVRKVTICR